MGYFFLAWSLTLKNAAKESVRAMCIGDPFHLCWASAALVIAILCAASAGMDIIDTSLHRMRWRRKRLQSQSYRARRGLGHYIQLHRHFTWKQWGHRRCYCPRSDSWVGTVDLSSEGTDLPCWKVPVCSFQGSLRDALGKLWDQELVTHIEKLDMWGVFH